MCVWGGGVCVCVGGGAQVSEFFFTLDPNFK